MGQVLQTFTLRATLKTSVIMRGYLTLDALLMAELVTGDVSHFRVNSSTPAPPYFEIGSIRVPLYCVLHGLKGFLN